MFVSVMTHHSQTPKITSKETAQQHQRNQKLTSRCEKKDTSFSKTPTIISKETAQQHQRAEN